MDGSVQNRRPGPPRQGIAERIWDSARVEFSKRGYHGARVQGIARGASCNVALMYRHWASKRALYLDILRAVWIGTAKDIAQVLDGGGGAQALVGAYLDAMMKDPMGAQILIREYLDGAPFLSQLVDADPSLLEPVRQAAATLSRRDGDGFDPLLAVVTVGGLAALVASARNAAPFFETPVAPEVWRSHVFDLLVNGLASGSTNGGGPAGGPAARPSAGANGAA